MMPCTVLNLCLPTGAHSQQFGRPTEGVNGRRTTYMTQRTSLCDAIYNLLNTRGYVLINAPPQSGKTSILQLYADYIAKRGGACNYINAATVSGSFDAEFARIFGGTLQELLDGGCAGQGSCMCTLHSRHCCEHATRCSIPPHQAVTSAWQR